METYQRVMPHLVTPPFKPSRVQTHSRSASKFSSERSEEQSEGSKMEVYSVVALEPQPIELEVNFSIGILSSIVYGFGEVEGASPIQPLRLPKL
jgi:hypothetical protein